MSLTRTKNIDYENLAKLNKPFNAAYKKKFAQILDAGWFILGNEVKSFEKEFAQYTSSAQCVGVASGLDAITISLLALGFEKGKEVLLPSNTYIATILSVLQAGLKPVLVEPDLATYNFSMENAVAQINANTVAIVVVHLYGKCCNMDNIMQLAKKHNLEVIEDCAQAHGAKFKEKQAGTFGKSGAFSFYPTKNLGALGDGGSINTDDEKFAIECRKLRNYGSAVKYYNELIGVNSRLDEVQAGFLRIKLEKLDAINAHKRSLAEIYFKNLTEKVIKPVQHSDYFDVFHIFNIRTDRREALRNYLMGKGVKTEIHYPVAPNKQIAMQPYLSNTVTPIAQLIHETTLSLPISTVHSKSDVKYVCDVINSFFEL